MCCRNCGSEHYTPAESSSLSVTRTPDISRWPTAWKKSLTIVESSEYTFSSPVYMKLSSVSRTELVSHSNLRVDSCPMVLLMAAFRTGLAAASIQPCARNSRPSHDWMMMSHSMPFSLIRLRDCPTREACHSLARITRVIVSVTNTDTVK